MRPADRAVAPTRRHVLVGVVTGLTLAGCGVDLGRLTEVRWDRDEPIPERTPGPDELARRDAVTLADTLHRSTGTAATAAGGDLGTLLSVLAAGHGAQLDALGATDLAVETPTPAPETVTTPPAEPVLLPVQELPAAETAAAFAALAAIEQPSGPMARLLASVAAADVVHARLLAAALGQEPPEVPSTVTDATRQRWASSLDDDAAAALTAALQGEYAAAHGYGLVAARLRDGAREQAAAHLAAHEVTAATLTEVLREADRPVPVAEPAYALPAPAGTEGEVRALALTLEERCAARYAATVQATTDGARLLVADELVAAALRGAAWRGTSVPLPGFTTG